MLHLELPALAMSAACKHALLLLLQPVHGQPGAARCSHWQLLNMQLNMPLILLLLLLLLMLLLLQPVHGQLGAARCSHWQQADAQGACRHLRVWSKPHQRKGGELVQSNFKVWRICCEGV
jgi:hypothetical protein